MGTALLASPSTPYGEADNIIPQVESVYLVLFLFITSVFLISALIIVHTGRGNRVAPEPRRPLPPGLIAAGSPGSPDKGKGNNKKRKVYPTDYTSKSKYLNAKYPKQGSEESIISFVDECGDRIYIRRGTIVLPRYRPQTIDRPSIFQRIARFFRRSRPNN